MLYQAVGLCWGLGLQMVAVLATAYFSLSTVGCKLLSTSKNFKKRETNYIFTLPGKVSLEKVDVAIGKIEKNLRGTPDLSE